MDKMKTRGWMWVKKTPIFMYAALRISHTTLERISYLVILPFTWRSKGSMHDGRVGFVGIIR